MNFEAVNNRVVALIDLNQKNYHTFSNGVVIHHERNWDNFDRKHTEQVLGTVISADNIPAGALVLFHHNGTHDVNKVFDHAILSGEDIASGLQVFSIPETECYLWKEEGGEWMPTKGFVIADRVFEPYTGIIEGIPPKQLKDTLYIKSGEYAGKVARTLKSADYEIIFRSPTTGQEQRIIRCRHFEDECHEREEIVAIDHGLTERVKNGELLLGTSIGDAKYLNEYICQ
jgi:hypothetical protein